MEYTDVPSSFQFQPIVVETLGPINDSATDFLDRLGQMISARTNEIRERMYLCQRISVTYASNLRYYSAFQRKITAATIRTSDFLFFFCF